MSPSSLAPEKGPEALAVILHSLFPSLTLEQAKELALQGCEVFLRAKQRVTAPQSPEGEEECYYLLLEGQLALVISYGVTPQEIKKASKRRPMAAKQEYVGLFVPGDVFSDAYLDEHEGLTDPQVDLVALTAVHLLRYPLRPWGMLLDRYPVWSQQLRELNARHRSYFHAQELFPRKLIQDFYLRHHFSSSTRITIVHSERCIDCQGCIKACAQLYGKPRLSLDGPRLGRLRFARACGKCLDHPCLAVCRFEAITLDEQGNVQITEACTGCGACTKACPQQAITLIDQVLPGQSPPAQKVAHTCDHCRSRPEPACLRACPTHALSQLSPAEVFGDRHGCDRSAWESFSGVPFVEGILEHRGQSQNKRLFPLITALTFILLLAIGLESFLRQTMPERSLQFYWGLWQGAGASAVGFFSGRGLGHILGYLGSALMLLALLYPLQSRLGWFQEALSRRSWLFLHLWVGLAGATLTTYHTSLKFDRWAGLATAAMWLVIFTGAVGRFLYGRVHSGLGLVEFAEQQLSERQGAMLPQGSPYSFEALGIMPPTMATSSGRRRYIPLVLFMVRDEIRDRLTLFWLKRIRLRHLHPRQQRQQLLQFVADWLRLKRNRSYLQQVKRLLASWNWLHLWFCLIMFFIAALHIYYALVYSGW
jgi:electron transport protein HydN